MFPRKVPGLGIDLFGVEADVVGQPDQLLHRLRGFVDASGTREGIDQEERAAQEGPLAAAQAVLAAVAIEQRATAQLPPQGIDRRDHLGVVGAAVVHQRAEEHAGVQFAALRRANVGTQLVRPAAGLDEVANPARLRPPSRSVALRKPTRVGHSRRAVERHPAHHLGVGEVTRLAADLPDAAVGLAPDLTDEVCGLGQPAAGLAIESVGSAAVEPRRLHQIAVDVELALVDGPISHPYGLGVAVAGQGELGLGRPGAAVEAVEDPQTRMGQLRGMEQPPKERVGLPAGSPAASTPPA